MNSLWLGFWKRGTPWGLACFHSTLQTATDRAGFLSGASLPCASPEAGPRDAPSQICSSCIP